MSSSFTKVPVETTEVTGRLIMLMGGKGGVGKTTVAAVLADYYLSNQVDVKLLDLDTENKSRGSLSHFYKEQVHKINIHTAAGLDCFVDIFADGAQLGLADMGSGAGDVAAQWFDAMYEDVAALGITFTAIGVVTPDPASVESVLTWANVLQNRVSYLIVENAISPQADFSCWHDSVQADKFRRVFHPRAIRMEYRLPEIERAARQHGATLAQIAARASGVPELSKTSVVIRAGAYRRRLHAEFDSVREVLLP